MSAPMIRRELNFAAMTSVTYGTWSTGVRLSNDHWMYFSPAAPAAPAAPAEHAMATP